MQLRPGHVFHFQLYSRKYFIFLSFSCKLVLTSNHRPIAANTALNAEWEKDWKESNFEADLAKVQEEAEKRLEEKVAELAANIENSGK